LRKVFFKESSKMEDERKIGGNGPLGLNLISGIGGSNTIG
jgi:hypothetical protein